MYELWSTLLKAGSIGEHYRADWGDFRSLDYGSYGVPLWMETTTCRALAQSHPEALSIRSQKLAMEISLLTAPLVADIDTEILCSRHF